MMKCVHLLCLCTLVFVLVLEVHSRATESPNVTTEAPTSKPTQLTTQPTTQPPPPVTTLTPEEDCATRNSSCDACLKSAKCMWCKSKTSCMLYPSGKVLPTSSDCALDDARWGVCWVNFKVLIIVMGCVGALIVLGITIVICCCCCCRKKSSASYDKDDAKYERKKMERRAKSDDRRAERKTKTDEIRKKYGLIRDDNPYSRFDET